jgi:protein tyrosine/serine phosphatase
MDQPARLSVADRLRLYWWKDHGWLRGLWTNFHRLDGDVWRHNHPSPARLARLKALGAASVLSLRGDTAPPSLIEAEACAALGLDFRAIEMRAVILPRREALLDLIAALREMPKPMVIHCKSGSDRTGLAATIYLHVFKGVPLSEARRQLGLRFIHNPWGRAGIVNALLDAYDAAHAATGIGFEDWVRTDYDQVGLMA